MATSCARRVWSGHLRARCEFVRQCCTTSRVSEFISDDVEHKVGDVEHEIA